MVFCSIGKCGNSSKVCNYNNKSITFHSFPKDPYVKDKWILATGKRNWFPTRYSRLCSVHFREDDFNPTTQRRNLLKDAYPTIDVWTTTEKSTDKTQSSPSIPSSPLPSKPDKQPMELDQDITETLINFKMRRVIQMKQSIINSQRLKIKSLQTKNRRYLKKINKLQEALKTLEEKRFMNGD